MALSPIGRIALYSIAGVLVMMAHIACTGTAADSIKTDAAAIARMQCKSRSFTHQKFLLSDQYGRLDDQLLSKRISKRAADSLRKTLDEKKAMLMKASQQQSDSLHRFLKSVWHDKYPSEEDKALLDSLTKAELERTCKDLSL